MTGPGKFNQAALKAAEQQVRLVMMSSGGSTLDQIDRFAPGFTRAVVGAYLSELRLQQPGVPLDPAETYWQRVFAREDRR